MYNDSCSLKVVFQIAVLDSFYNFNPVAFLIHFGPRGIFYRKIFRELRYAPLPYGCRPLGGVLSASCGDRLRWVSSGFDFSARLVEHGALCETWLSFSSRDKLGTAWIFWIFWILRKVVCKVLCLCLPLGLPDGPNPRGIKRAMS